MNRLLACIFLCAIQQVSAQQSPITLESLLQDMQDVSNLALLEDSRTEMSSTWDRNGGNNDNADFKQLEGNYNVLLDIDGPGVVSRIFTGVLSGGINEAIDLNRTNLQIYIDNQPQPVIDCPVKDFFTANEFTRYPFVFDSKRTYPGFLLPIPFAKHIKVQLRSKDEFPVFEHWGSYWQVTYTRYAAGTPVKSFALPLTGAEKEKMAATGAFLIEAEQDQFLRPDQWGKTVRFEPGKKKKNELTLKGEGTIESFRVNLNPNTPEALKAVRLRVYWDGHATPSVDLPLGYFFGNADYASALQYGSLLTGIDSLGGFSRFPMPFRKQARFEFVVPENSGVQEITLQLNHWKGKVPANAGYFHTTWTEQWATEHEKRPGQRLGELNIPTMPKYGKRNVPVHIAMDRSGFKGKYVGLLLHVAWPSMHWWGEGDVLIWTDENTWPPSYHGTGTEEYFNSGWGEFDRKAATGYIKKGTGNILLYAFHTVDAFNFSNSFKIGLERWNVFTADDHQRCIWGSTAFWYAASPQTAESKKELLQPRLQDKEGVPFTEVWK